MTGRLRTTLSTGVGLALAVSAVLAQALDLSGTWRLDKAASQITAGAGLDGLGAGGAPSTLYTTHAANGDVTVGSDENESHAHLYRVNRPSSLPPPRAGGQFVPIKSRIEGRSLIAEGEGLKAAFALSADGQTLTVTITRGANSSALVYKKTQTADDCKSWPTPCR